ncbi:fibronectin type III domain-containing protein, partial [Flavobacterium sp.]|uniref:DUF7619 domain-containing protein n=1 Tax=Flavobacterium sp. TaxID=239 RepID=UPI003752E885
MKKHLLISLFAIFFSSFYSSYSQTGFSCTNATPIASLPYQTTDNTANYSDVYDVSQPTTCITSTLNYMTGNDVFYSYTPANNEIINIKMTPLAGWSGIFVYDGCSNLGISCVAGVANSGSTLREIPQLSVLAGHTYIIAISTNATPQTLGYTLQIQNAGSCLSPTQISASNITSSSVSLSWNNIASSSSWEVALVASGTALPSNGIVTNSNVGFTISNLTPATSYQAYVRSDCGNGTFSNWSAATTIVTSPSCATPTLVTVSNVTSSSANFAWANNSNATSWEYAVQLSSVTTLPSSGTTTTTNAAIPSGLIASSSYKFYVRAFCSNQTFSAWTTPYSFTTSVSCAVPTQIISSNITTTTVDISWLNNANATSWEYAVQLSTLTTLPTSGTLTSSNTISLSGLTSGVSYKVYVRSLCTNQSFSAWSAGLLFTTIPPGLQTPVCGGDFTDNGGLNAFYFNNTDATTTIYPTNAGEVVTVTFTAFDTEANWDGLYVFNGNSINSPIISSGNSGGSVPGGLAGSFSGTTIPGPFTSSSSDGSLTFRFRSDSLINKAGWNASVSCGASPTCSTPILSAVSNITFSGGTINWQETGTATQWEVIVLPSSASAPTGASTGIITSSNPYVITGLSVGTYKIYIRSICSTSDSSVWSSPLTFSTSTCPAPTTISNNGSYNFSWPANNATLWEVLVLQSTNPNPTATSLGTTISSNFYQATGLACSSSYTFYVRTICSGTLSSNWSALSFTTPTCSITNGQPVNMTSCNDSGTSCFNLNDNNISILGSTNSANIIITYYSSLSNATSETNALLSPYCVTNNTQTIYARINNTVTLEHQIVNFTVTSQSISPTIFLSGINQCDDNGDGNVVFDLTNNPQITTINPLSYYTSLANAISLTSPITNIINYSVPISSAAITIFVRESIVNDCDKIYSIPLSANSDCNLAHNCNLANSLCSALGNPFTNTHQGINAEIGNSNNYGCLYSTPNPTWFYLPVSSPGTLNLTIEQSTTINFTTNNLDVDYIVYGPFTNPISPCASGLNQSNTVSCSYSGAAVEHPVIANAQVGEYYLLMVTNFSNQAGFIRINMDTTSTGAIDCSGLRLNAFLDNNNNGSQDNGEVNFPIGQFHYTVNSGNVHNVIAPTGVYNIYDINGTNLYDFNYTIDPSYNAMYAISTSSYSNVNVVIGGGMVTYNFPITVTQVYNDLAVALVPMNAPRTGTTYQNKLVYTNLGSQTISSGTVTFNNNNATVISSISQAGTTSIINGFTYTFSNLLPFETRVITITMQVPPIPTVSIGQLLTNTASIVSVVGDLVPSNNASSLTQAVIGAYDPNDKIESHGEKVLFSTFSATDYLYYTIRFENTGTTSAININVNDILDSKIDETSLLMVSASHDYTMDRVGTNLTWSFNNIQLPVSIAETNIGKGYITFKVKL